MSTTFRSFLCAALLGLPGSLFAASTTTPFVQVEQSNVFAKWTPNQLAKTQSTVDLVVYLPSEGIYNDWRITLTSGDGNGAQYQYQTSDGSFQSAGSPSPLGTITEGTYDVSFENLNGRDAYVEYSFCEGQWWRTNEGNNDITVRNVAFVNGCNQIVIDAEIRMWPW